MAWITPGTWKLRCDACGTEVHMAGSKNEMPDGWGDLRTFGNDGSPGVVMASWHFCESCAERAIRYMVGKSGDEEGLEARLPGLKPAPQEGTDGL